jgi:putative transposase
VARRPRLFAPGVLYHVIVRGNQRRKTFLTEDDYRAYLERLARYRKRLEVTVYAYCLMPNHAHLLLETSSEPLSKFMQALQQSYTQYFNQAHRKVGHVFQGRYQAIVCDKDEYLLALVRYIHLNPVRAKITRRPEQYKHSGHGAYLQSVQTEVIDPRAVLQMLGRRGYQRFVLDGIDGGHKEEYYRVEDQRFLGAKGFGEKMTKEAERVNVSKARRSLSEVIKEVADKLNIGLEILAGPDRSWAISKQRALIAYLLVRRLGYRLTDVARYLGRDTATVSSLLLRFAEKMKVEEKSKKEIDRLVKII